MRKKCRHTRAGWRRCGCQWVVTIGGVTHRLGSDEREAARAEKEMRRRGVVEDGETFGAVAERWLRGIEARRRPKTAANYRWAVEHLAPRIGHWPVRRITAVTLADAEALIAAEADLARGSMRNIRAAALGVLGYAAADRIIDRVPDMRAGYGITDDAEPARHLEPDEMREVLAKADGQVAPCLRLGYLTGLRPGELVAVRGSDIDGHVLHVRRQIVQATGQPGPLKTPKSRRDVDLPDAAVACVAGAGTGRLSPVLYHTLLARWHDALDAAGSERCGLHALRHSNASLRLAAGQDIVYVAAQLGHASPAITLRIYGHLIRGPRQDPEALARLAGM